MMFKRSSQEPKQNKALNLCPLSHLYYRLQVKVAVFCQGFKNEGIFVPSPLKMRRHFQNIEVYVVK